MQEYEQILAWFESFNTKDKQTELALTHQVSGNLTLEQILDTIMQGRLSTQATFFITDYRCLDHADFTNGKNLAHRVHQREV